MASKRKDPVTDDLIRRAADEVRHREARPISAAGPVVASRGEAIFEGRPLDKQDTKERVDLGHSIGSAMKALRRAAGLSLDDMAKEAGVGRMTVVRYEAGQIADSRPAFTMLDAVEAALREHGASGLLAEVARVRLALVRFMEMILLPAAAAVASGFGEDIQELVAVFRSLPPEGRKEFLVFARGFVAGWGKPHARG